ncbi:MAG: hypothetical protein P5702_20450 [Limnospira sp. PMC 1291.21]|uniref:Uncharacterized protein n=2 Tax=Limnospira TaxID=2596745 RepID=B5W8N6_LIMMA|nr:MULTISPECIES: hypothetical protein [Limnospira]MDC0840372.1 hypothetical protein [Limnoraphis robusta]MDY7051280.1 hypothetical protein [Limnospira fusiformis LS22]QJB27717.1 hypothetical protein HFV01_20435 [Limnospira fusiformis SAG 85.79]EDZ92093.1 hypothetical protein AmaxDRAFT_5136 [Limnospira maxima CS-328]MDT9180028.1 hypothetical protein [Limnospira sp. PMC 1238.20]
MTSNPIVRPGAEFPLVFCVTTTHGTTYGGVLRWKSPDSPSLILDGDRF